MISRRASLLCCRSLQTAGLFSGLIALDCTIKIPVNFTLSIDAETADSDETLRFKARSQVDRILRTVGEAAGEFVWNQIDQDIGRVAGSKPAYMRDCGERAIKKASNIDRSDVEEELFNVLKIQAINWARRVMVRGQHAMDADIRIKWAVDAAADDSDEALRAA